MGGTSGQEALLGAFSRVRLIASLAKIDAAVALAKSILEKEGSIVVFTYFVNVAKKVHKKLQESGWSGELLVGETPADKRQVSFEFQVENLPLHSTHFFTGNGGQVSSRNIIVFHFDFWCWGCRNYIDCS